MSKAKTEILGPAISDFLKYEATPLTRVAIAASQGTKAGTFVKFPLRSEFKLLALTDEADGKSHRTAAQLHHQSGSMLRRCNFAAVHRKRKVM